MKAPALDLDLGLGWLAGAREGSRQLNGRAMVAEKPRMPRSLSPTSKESSASSGADRRAG